ncbi:hypothetical protein ACS5NO_17420 [Larkinella sp. GY13]|uniref:hypothetical protein n=1 Tax=Larkinella sp. GY13 TaxID=3453720 RepID=UPI003EEB7681
MKIRITPNEFLGLVNFLYGRISLITSLQGMERSIYDQVLLEYWSKTSLLEKVSAWRHRNSRQRYSLPMPLSVIRILHQEMQFAELTIYGQALLARLDMELVNISY